jgi:hypothetical protein
MTATPIPDIADWAMWDAHAECYGYLSSPADGDLFAPLTRILHLNAAAGVRGCRLFGVAAQYLYRLSTPPLPAVEVVPVAPYLDGALDGFRISRVCPDTAAVDRGVAAIGADEYRWIAVGRALPADLRAHCVSRALGAAIAVAAEAAPTLRPDGIRSVEGLLGLVSDPVPERPAWRRVADLAGRDPAALLAGLAPWIEHQVPIVPLLLRLRRACVLEDALGAARMDELCDVLPYHRHLAQMRNPAALKFGRRHVTKHLGYHRFDRDEWRSFSAGWEVLTGLLCYLDAAGATLAGGSGAPATGMCPGYALREEARLWLGVGVAAPTVRKAFGPVARALVTARASADAEELT